MTNEPIPKRPISGRGEAVCGNWRPAAASLAPDAEAVACVLVVDWSEMRDGAAFWSVVEVLEDDAAGEVD